MAFRFQLRRGTTAQNQAFTGAAGEVTCDTTLKEARLHDGVTAGGRRFSMALPTSPEFYTTFANFLSGVARGVTSRVDADYSLASFENTKGLIFEGNGRILTPVTGGEWQRNSYSPLRTLHMGHEYLERAYAFFDGSLGTLNIRIFGDSTATDDYGGAVPSAVVRRAMQERGLPNFVLTNQAVSGTTWADCNAIASLSPSTGLIFLKYGVNDANLGIDLEDSLSILYANMDAKLTAIRADVDGGLADLSIVLVGPNSTSDSPNDRDERWYERVRGIYVAMARKHHCAYFDTYGQFLDSRPAANIYMDDPYADGRAIHPTNKFNARIWGKLMDEFFSRGQVALYSSNLLTNDGNVSTVVSATTPPSAFNFGISINRAAPAGGWPIDGFVKTTKGVDDGVMQELWNFSSTTRVARRTANIGSDAWNEWAGISVPIPLSNGWLEQGAPWQSPIATKTSDGIVVCEGLVNSGTTAAGTIIGTLPVGFRPPNAHLFVVAANGGSTRLDVRADGTIRAFTGGADGTFTSFSGITFRTI